MDNSKFQYEIKEALYNLKKTSIYNIGNVLF